MPDLETVARGSVAGATVVAWEIRARDQCCLASLSHPDLFLCVLAPGDACSAEFDELGGGDVCRGDCLGVGVLFCLGEGFVCWAGCDREAGGVDGVAHELVVLSFVWDTKTLCHVFDQEIGFLDS